MTALRIVLFADKDVGGNVLEHMLTKRREHLAAVVLTTPTSPLLTLCQDAGLEEERIVFSQALYEPATLDRLRAFAPDYFVLAWWPDIVKGAILSIPRIGALNFHPSLLPHNRGKHPNFWSIVEQRPFGVTIHFATPEVDAGDVVFQRVLPTTWEDTGGSLHRRAREAIVDLFIEGFDALLDHSYERTKQDPGQGSTHLGAELEPASRIELDQQYTARELLNLLRARTFPPHPACRFDDAGVTYEVRVEIRRV